MARSHHDDQDENRLGYPDLSRRLAELQNETSHRRTTLPADPNEEGPANQAETPWNIENVLQLQHWATHDAEEFLSVFNQCRKDRDEAVRLNDQCLEALKEQAEAVKNLVRDKDSYKTRSRNYHHQLSVSKEELASSKDELEEIRQANEELQQEVSELRAANEATSSQRRRRPPRSPSPAERTRRDTPDTNTSVSTRKSTKHPDPEPFISRREGPRWEEWRQKIEIKMIVNADHWDNEAARIGYVCSRTSGEAAGHVYARSGNFSDDLYETWQDVVKDLAETYEDSDWKDKYRQLYLNLRQGSDSFVDFYAKFRQYTSRLGYLKKSRDQLEMVDALLDKVSPRLRVVYDNLLEPPKTLEEIKAYFTRVDNRHRVTRETREKEKTQETDRAARPPTSKRFVPSSSRPAYTPQLPAPPRRTIDYRKQKDVDENACFNCHEQGHVAADCPKPRKRVAQVNNLDPVPDGGPGSVHTISESDSDHASSGTDSDFERKN